MLTLTYVRVQWQWVDTMRYYVYLSALFISVVLAVLGGVGFRFLEVEHESKTAEKAYAQLKELLGKWHRRVLHNDGIYYIG